MAGSSVRPRIDLYSDTQTRPSPAMRQAIAEAEVGDEQRGEDPTVNRLQDRVAELLGKPRALFLPSGTMCNEIAYRVWARPGEEVILDQTAHALHFETGGPAALSGPTAAANRSRNSSRGVPALIGRFTRFPTPRSSASPVPR